MRCGGKPMQGQEISDILREGAGHGNTKEHGWVEWKALDGCLRLLAAGRRHLQHGPAFLANIQEVLFEGGLELIEMLGHRAALEIAGKVGQQAGHLGAELVLRELLDDGERGRNVRTSFQDRNGEHLVARSWARRGA
eukprot:13578438-Alexandrium_andersonii.AAC.1